MDKGKGFLVIPLRSPESCLNESVTSADNIIPDLPWWNKYNVPEVGIRNWFSEEQTTVLLAFSGCEEIYAGELAGSIYSHSTSQLLELSTRYSSEVTHCFLKHFQVWSLPINHRLPGFILADSLYQITCQMRRGKNTWAVHCVCMRVCVCLKCVILLGKTYTCSAVNYYYSAVGRFYIGCNWYRQLIQT